MKRATKKMKDLAPKASKGSKVKGGMAKLPSTPVGPAKVKDPGIVIVGPGPIAPLGTE